MPIRIFSKNVILIFILIPTLGSSRMYDAISAVIGTLNPYPDRRAFWDPLGLFESCEASAKSHPTRFFLNKNGQKRNLSEELLTPFASFRYHRQTLFDGELDPHEEIVFLIHGFLHGCEHKFVLSTKETYLRFRPKTQVITVCWSKALTGLDNDVGAWSWGTYPVALLGTNCVGQTVAIFMEHLHNDLGVPWDNMSIVSHSLGTQVAGAAGNALGHRLKTLIALDPSYGLLGVNNLKNTSAEQVIVLHTSMALAQLLPTGTADFYVNMGMTQPGCNKMMPHNREQCAHYRSVELFNESLENPKAFLARETKRGRKKTYFSQDTKARGVFAFKAGAKKPFSISSD